MQDLNKVLLTGRTVKDIETRNVGQHTVATFSLAVNNGYGDKETTDFFDLEAWGKQAEILAEYAKKGKPLTVVARLKQDKWEKDDKKFSKVILVVEDFKLGGTKDAQ